MIISDTHSWLWWTVGDPNLSVAARRAMDGADEIGAPAMVCWEIALLESRNQIRLEGSARVWLRDALSQPTVTLIPLSPEIAVLANSFGTDLHRDPVDRLIVATALDLGAPIVTRDERIRAFNRVRCIW